MNWKKAFKYTAVILAILFTLSLYWLDQQGQLMYGGLTTVVEHEQFKPKSGVFIITKANVLSEDGSHFIPEQNIVISNGAIKTISDQTSNIHEATLIDGQGKYLIPGLIDAHVHLFKSPNDLLLYIANGVTQIRELIGEEDHLAWRTEIENGRVGPQMFVASPRLGSFPALQGFFMEQTQGFKNVRTAEEGKAIVKALKEQGYDGLKIYSHLNSESYEAITQTAKELDMPTFGHIPFTVEFDDIWHSGQSDIAHFEEVMNALQREFGQYEGAEIEKMFGSFKSREEQFLAYINQRSEAVADSLLKYDISVTSTLWLTQSFVRQKVAIDEVLREVALAYENPGIAEGNKLVTRALGWLPHVNRYRYEEGLTEGEKADRMQYWQAYGDACQLLAKNFAKKGVKIMAGTDANLPPTIPGFSLHDELVALHEAGMSTTQVLHSATTVPAEWLQTNTGKIVSGQTANIVLLDENPLLDIRNTKKINTVIAQGRVYDRELLDDMLAAVKAANDASRSIDISQYLPPGKLAQQ